MRVVRWAALVGVLVATTIAWGLLHARDTCRDEVVSRHAGLVWTAGDSLRADLTFDGVPELIMAGEKDGTTVVAIAQCEGERLGRSWALTFDFAATCGSTEVDLTLENPAPGKGYYLEQCLGAEDTPECRALKTRNTRLRAAHEAGAYGLRVGVPDCDGLHVYWNAEKETFETWRP